MREGLISHLFRNRATSLTVAFPSDAAATAHRSSGMIPRVTGWQETRRTVLTDSLGVGVAVGAYGISFGALGVTSGLSVLQTCALSVLTFTGGSQFAFIGVLAAGGSPWSGATTGMLLGVRNTLYGLRLAPLLELPARPVGWSGHSS